MEEIEVQADIAESKALYRHDKAVGVAWVDSLRASVRPVITYAFFLLFASVKGSALYVLIAVEGLLLAEALPRIWDPEIQALFAVVMSFWFGHGIGEGIGEELLRLDVEVAERVVLRLIRVPLADGQFDALVSFTFNLGPGALQRSTLRRKVNREEHEAVPAEFRRWVWAGGRKLKGLMCRRHAEAICYSKAR